MNFTCLIQIFFRDNETRRDFSRNDKILSRERRSRMNEKLRSLVLYQRKKPYVLSVSYNLDDCMIPSSTISYPNHQLLLSGTRTGTHWRKSYLKITRCFTLISEVLITRRLSFSFLFYYQERKLKQREYLGHNWHNLFRQNENSVWKLSIKVSSVFFYILEK